MAQFREYSIDRYSTWLVHQTQHSKRCCPPGVCISNHILLSFRNAINLFSIQLLKRTQKCGELYNISIGINIIVEIGLWTPYVSMYEARHFFHSIRDMCFYQFKFEYRDIDMIIYASRPFEGSETSRLRRMNLV